MMVEDKLDIIKIYKEIMKEVYESMINIPKVHYALKEVIVRDMSQYLCELYIANDIRDKNERMKLKEKQIIKLKYISSLIFYLKEYKILGEKKYLVIYDKMGLILRMMNSWKNV